jgi:hypothetical protein
LCTGWFTVLGLVSCCANATEPTSAALIRLAYARFLVISTSSYVHSSTGVGRIDAT